MCNFFIDETTESQLYKYLRDDLEQQACDARAFTNYLWDKTFDYADLNIQSDAKNQFHQRFWEMYLIATLLEQGFSVVKREDKRFRQEGPDIQIGNLSAWLEATTVTSGFGSDAVHELDPESKVAMDVPQDKIKLRLTGAIQTKYLQYQNYKKNGVVKEGEPYIIALNAALIEHLQVLELSVPWVVQALFPIGHEVIQLNINTKQVVDKYHDYRDFAVKENGTQISTNFFEKSDSEGISAVLYSTAHVFGYRELGAGFKLVHNPKATTPIPKGFLKLGTEYWMQEEQLCWQKHSK